jgi:hypothetical protein
MAPLLLSTWPSRLHTDKTLFSKLLPKQALLPRLMNNSNVCTWTLLAIACDKGSPSSRWSLKLLAGGVPPPNVSSKLLRALFPSSQDVSQAKSFWNTGKP